MRKLLLKLLFLSIACPGIYPATAQRAVSVDSLKARYDHETIHFFRGYPAKGESKERIRFKDLKNEFIMSPEGKREFNLSKKKITTATISFSFAFAMMTAGSLIYYNDKSNSLGRGLMLGGVAAEIFSIPFAISAHKKLHQAVWLRNRDVLFSGK